MNTPIFVLSLKNSHDRRTRISGRLSELGLPFRFFDAIPAGELSRASWARLIDRDGAARKAGKQMTEAEFSCALSHALIYQMIVDQGHRHAFILEDDAILSDDFAAFVSDCTFEKSGEDFVSFYFKFARVSKYKTQQIGRGYTLRKQTKPCSHSTGYFLSQRGARFLWENSIPVCDVADWGADITRIGAKVTVPNLIGHPPEESVSSTIKSRNLARRSLLLRILDRNYLRYKLRKPFSELIYCTGGIDGLRRPRQGAAVDEGGRSGERQGDQGNRLT